METTFDHNKLIKKIGNERLSPYGIIQEGKSRTFLYDNGWWTIVIEFQPSSFSKGSYLNIGLDFNFYPRDYFAFTYGGREKGFEEVSDEAQFIQIINEYCDFIIEKVAELRSNFADVWTATKTFKKKNDKDPWDNFELGILYALTGQNRKSTYLLEKVKKEKCEHDFEFERQKLVIQIISWTKNEETFISKMKGMINQTRQLKKLAIVDLGGLTDKKTPNKESSTGIGLLTSLWNKLYN